MTEHPMTDATPLASEQITQEDREAAADSVTEQHGCPTSEAGYVRDGQWDDHPRVIEFARYRRSLTTQKNAEALARQFHDTYERLAPSFGYETRADTKAFDPESANGKLMIAVCAALAAAPAPSGQEVAGDAERLAATFECAEIWTPNADAPRMNGPAVARIIRAAIATTPPASGVTVPEGMKAWNGGESAPEDWDGGPVKLRCGDMEPASLIEEADWQIGYPENGFKPSQVDIIAYTPAALSTPSATPGEEA